MKLHIFTLILSSGITNTWTSGNFRTGYDGNGVRGNLPFTLYLIDATTGFSDDINGAKYYSGLCKAKGFLQVGCGGDSDSCEKHSNNGEPCLPLPETWGCNMLGQLSTNTGWGNNIVALQGYGNNRNEYLYTPSGHPNKNENRYAVCGRVTSKL